MTKSDKESEIKRILPKAEHGDIIAMLDLYMLYQQTENWEEAYFWASVSEKYETGSNTATPGAFGDSHLTPQQKSTVATRVATWEPLPISDEVKQEWEDLQLNAKNGNAQAQFDLAIIYTRGHLYWSGWGAKVDYEEAFKLYRMAADQGHVEAQFELGEGFSKGLGVKPDYAEALKWYSKAADQGHAKAKENAELLLANGYGTLSKK